MYPNQGVTDHLSSPPAAGATPPVPARRPRNMRWWMPAAVLALSAGTLVLIHSTITDNGYLWRTYPSDTLQGNVLAQAVIDAFGKGATVNVGARNDAFGVALKQLFVTQFEKLGGKVGVNISWNPDQPNFDSEMGQLVGGRS